MDYLVDAIHPGRYELANHTTDVISNLKPLHKVVELIYLLSLCNMYGLSVPKGTHPAALINKKIESGELRMFNTHWQEKQEVLSIPQKNLISVQILVLPRGKAHFTIDKDGGDNKIGCVLTQ